MVEALSHKAQQNVRPFLPFLQDSRTDLVRSVAGILAGAKSDQAIPALTGLLKHPDFQVRRDALSALSKLGSGRAMDMLADSLFDRDPRIRMAGARYLGMSGRQSIPILITVIESEDFDQRPLPEKRSFYEALGYAGGTDMLPLMERALKRKSWLFGKTEATEIRACACEALGWIGGPEARELLNLGMHDRSVLVRTAAQSGLRRIAAGKKEPLLKEAA
jgi:HEAT repeat protein